MPGRFRGPPGWWNKRFHGCGYRLTMPRQAVFEVLNKTSKHLSAEDIYLEVHKIYPMTGLSSVYRILEWLVQLGTVVKFDFGDGRARYELVKETKDGHHHHLVCTNCKRVVDYTDFIDEEIELLKKTEKALSKKYDFEIRGHIMQFKGLCDKCKSKK